MHLEEPVTILIHGYNLVLSSISLTAQAPPMEAEAQQLYNER